MGEAQKFVVFPNGCSMKQMTNLLGLYGGCDSEELRRLRRLPSRWVALCTTFPSLVLYETGCYLLHDDKAVKGSPTLKRAREEVESEIIEEAPKPTKATSPSKSESSDNEG